MIYKLDNPYGVDRVIQKIQESISEGFPDLDSYGKCLIEDDEPIYYVNGTAPKPILGFSDNKKGLSFFTHEEQESTRKQFRKSEIDFYFLCDLSLLNLSNNDIEVLINDIHAIIKKNTTRTDIGVQKSEALKDFKTELKQQYPYLFLKYTFTLIYKI